MKKFNDLIERLLYKMGKSQTPVPGFIMGLSGTDSIVTFMLLYRAAERMGIPHRVWGIHFVTDDKPHNRGWFSNEIMPWLAENAPEAKFSTLVPRGGNDEYHRWADLHLMALHKLKWDHTRDYPNLPKLVVREEGDNYWTVGTMNATEAELGTYSLISTAVSIQPIRTMWKSEVLQTCVDLGVPEIAMEYARIPDCFCGRDEIAAQNIEAIDAILRNNVDPHSYTPDDLKQFYDFIRDKKTQNGFKQRTPFKI